jgi:transposase InsO family protein
MDIHKNARLTLIRREQLALAVLVGKQTLNSAAAEFKVDPHTARKWVRRYQQEGRSGLQDRSSRPHHYRRQTHELLTQFVEVLRRQRWTGMHIAQALHLSRATVSRILRRLQISRLRDLEPAPPLIRYEHAAPGDMIHFDIKKLAVFDHRHNRRGLLRRRVTGAQYLHVAIDDHSRIAYAHVYPDQTARSALRFLYAAQTFYRRLGIRFRGVFSDNGPCYRSHRFRQYCRMRGLKQSFTRPYTPRTNGKAERFIQTLLREWVWARYYPSSDHRNSDLPLWLRHYNWHRPHASLNQAPPISRSAPDGYNLVRHNSKQRDGSVRACLSSSKFWPSLAQKHETRPGKGREYGENRTYFHPTFRLAN